MVTQAISPDISDFDMREQATGFSTVFNSPLFAALAVRFHLLAKASPVL